MQESLALNGCRVFFPSKMYLSVDRLYIFHIQSSSKKIEGSPTGTVFFSGPSIGSDPVRSFLNEECEGDPPPPPSPCHVEWPFKQ